MLFPLAVVIYLYILRWDSDRFDWRVSSTVAWIKAGISAPGDQIHDIPDGHSRKGK